MERGYNIKIEKECIKDIYNTVYNLAYGIMGIKTIRLLKLKDIPGVKEELEKIRQRFYGWMKNPAYLNLLISQGKTTVDDIYKKSFRNKDMGECELIAIAKTGNDDYIIVSDDKGKVFLHPEQNLFMTYAQELGLVVLNSEEWLEQINYTFET